MAVYFKTKSGSEYVVDGLRVKRNGAVKSSFDGNWWPLKAVGPIGVGEVVWLEVADGPERTHTFHTNKVDEIWYAGVA